MGAVVDIKRDALEVVDDLPELIRSGEITHMVTVLRYQNGDIRYKIIGLRELTYLIGMLQRTMLALDREHERWESGR